MTKSSSSKVIEELMIDCEVRPGGMLVQKRDADHIEEDGDVVPMIKLTVTYGTEEHEINVHPQASFGDVKRLLANVTGLEPYEQRLFFRGKEKEDEEGLHMDGVKDKCKVLLREDQASKERKFENEQMLEACEAVVKVRSALDSLEEKLSVYPGDELPEEEHNVLGEFFIRQLRKLDEINICVGLDIIQKEVHRVADFVVTIGDLKARNANRISNDKAVSVPTKWEKVEGGDLERLLADAGFEPNEKRSFFRGMEKEDEEGLHMDGVNDKCKVLLRMVQASKERKPEEVIMNEQMLEAFEAVGKVRFEVDSLTLKEKVSDNGLKVPEKEYIVLEEFLMRQFVKLDMILAAKQQRRLEARRVQNLVDTVGNLKARNANPISNDKAVSVPTVREKVEGWLGSLNPPPHIPPPSSHSSQNWEQDD